MSEPNAGEPFQPGWYPAGDDQHQRYYAGSGKGWTDRYKTEIANRDPMLHEADTYYLGEIIVFLAVIAASVTLTISLIFSLLTRGPGNNSEAPVPAEQIDEIAHDLE